MWTIGYREPNLGPTLESDPEFLRPALPGGRVGAPLSWELRVRVDLWQSGDSVFTA